MQKRTIGSSDLVVSEIGLGCMSLGTDENKAISIIDEAIDNGVNYLDTADLYDFGLNEEFVGKAIKGKRHDIILATKVGNRPHEAGDKRGWYWDASKTYIKEAVKNSLRRLDTDYIDLYQLHGGTMEDKIDETIEAFEELVKEGFIRYYGISSIRPNVIREYATRSSIISVMMQYSLLDRRPEEQVFPLLDQYNISVLARGPVAKGILTGKSVESLDSKIKENGYLNYSFEEICDIISTLRKEFPPNMTLNEIALQFCLHHKTVASVVTGASNIRQIADNIQAVNNSKLSLDQIRLLKELTIAAGYDNHRI
ncbi:aldo/keto reductase [Bacillus timonensis]|nr:aldo/keto reductase [Bacillus timonensis]